MPRFYRYVIYRLYSWRIKKGDDTPVATIVFGMTGVHFFQIMLVFAIFTRFYPGMQVLFRQNKIYIGILFFILSFAYYLMVYNKENWLQYIDEFKEETARNRRKGTVLLFSFTIGSVLLFLIIVPLLYF